MNLGPLSRLWRRQRTTTSSTDHQLMPNPMTPGQQLAEVPESDIKLDEVRRALFDEAARARVLRARAGLLTMGTR